MVTLPERADRWRDDVHALLEAHFTYDRIRETRAEVEWALIVASSLPALALVWPAAIPPMLRLFAFVAWAGLLVALLTIRLSERRWHRRMLERADALRE